ncbi:MAG: hypothetical protein AB1405_09565 [Bdellovibrionota bacterium]
MDFLDPREQRLRERTRAAMDEMKKETPEQRWQFLLDIGLIDEEGRVQTRPPRQRRKPARRRRG